MEEKTGKRFKGVVVSDKMKDSVVVEVESFKKHTRYAKFVKSVKKYMAHDAENKHEIGDKVVIEETRPISKRKKFKVIEENK